MTYDSLSTEYLAMFHAEWELKAEQVREIKDILRERYDADSKDILKMRCAQCRRLTDGTCQYTEETENDRRHYICNIHEFCPNF